MSSLINAPAYDPSRDNLIRRSLIAALVIVLLSAILCVGGYILGHGWFFSNLPAEHKVSKFLTALEAKDYQTAYNIYTNGHPDSGYPIQRFTEDWTTYSPVKGPIVSHHIEISKTDGTGLFGTGIIVAAHINKVPTCAFIYVLRSDGTLTYPALHEIGYDKCNNL
jgi:hypothetical protein